MRMFFMPVMVIALSACVTATQADADSSSVRLGQTAYINGPRVRPVAVLEDSRCPMNARCIWAGRVRLKMLWVKPTGDQEFELTLGEQKPLADGAITLTSVRPEKTIEGKATSADYRFSFDFQGGI